jgi:glycosyltransferase involved in cell wall biosynthesis
MIDVLWIADAYGTGYANASLAILPKILEGWGKNFHVDYLGVNYPDLLDPEDLIRERFSQDQQSQVTVHIPHRVSRVYGDDLYEYYKETMAGYRLLPELLKKNPAIIFIINDNGLLVRYQYIIKCIGYTGKVVFYMPVDKQTFLPGGFNEFSRLHGGQCDLLLTMNQHSRRLITETGYPEKVECLPHAIPSNIWTSLGLDRRLCRNKLYGHIGIPEEKLYIVVNMNKTTSVRKQLDVTLQSFAKFLLYFKENFEENLEEKFQRFPLLVVKDNPSLRLMVNKMGISKHVSFCDNSISIKSMNEIYTSADVGLNTSKGEGWGLVACEMALCAVPQIIPRNTSHPEIFGPDYDYIECDKIYEKPTDSIAIVKSYRSYDKTNLGIRMGAVKKDNSVKTLPAPDNTTTAILVSDNSKMSELYKQIELLDQQERFQIILTNVTDDFPDMTQEFSSMLMKRMSWVMPTNDIRMYAQMQKMYNLYPKVDDICRLLEKYLDRDLAKATGEICRKRMERFDTPYVAQLALDLLAENVGFPDSQSKFIVD